MVAEEARLAKVFPFSVAEEIFSSIESDLSVIGKTFLRITSSSKMASDIVSAAALRYFSNKIGGSDKSVSNVVKPFSTSSDGKLVQIQIQTC